MMVTWPVTLTCFLVQIDPRPRVLSWEEAPDFGPEVGDVQFVPAEGRDRLVTIRLLPVGEPDSLAMIRVEFFARAVSTESHLSVAVIDSTIHIACEPRMFFHERSTWRLDGPVHLSFGRMPQEVILEVESGIDLWFREPKIEFFGACGPCPPGLYR